MATGLEWVAPTIGGVFLVLAALATAIIGFRTSRNSGRENRAPDVTEAWIETDRARRYAHAMEDLFYTVRGALRGLARRMSEKDPDFELTADERAALETVPPPSEPR